MSEVVRSPDPRYPVLYSEELKERILVEYTGGLSLAAISKLPGMPAYQTILKWSKTNESFRKELLGARETRALHFEEKVIELSEKAEKLEKDEVPGSRLAFDTAAWLAEKADPARFGRRTTIGGDANNPIQFIISTGVPAPSEHQKPPELHVDGTVVKKISAGTVVPSGLPPTPDEIALKANEVVD